MGRSRRRRRGRGCRGDGRQRKVGYVLEEPLFEILDYHTTLEGFIQLTHVAFGMVDGEKGIHENGNGYHASLVLVQ